jgi:hypothetical protein
LRLNKKKIATLASEGCIKSNEKIRYIQWIVKNDESGA